MLVHSGYAVHFDLQGIRVLSMTFKGLCALISLPLLLTGCQLPQQVLNGGNTGPTVSSTPPSSTPSDLPGQDFATWQANFRQRAVREGIDPALLERAFAGLSPNSRIQELDRKQPEFSKPVWEYLDNAVSAQRIQQGRALLVQHQATLQSVARAYQVDPEVIVAIWGMESNFGSNFGSLSVIRSLATLAWDGRRRASAEEQLIAALRIVQQGDVTPERMVGSWAGAMGHTQFMPTTFLTHAVDFDGDHRRDLWNSLPDVFASTAHYLHASGWQFGAPWGYEVQLPAGFDWRLSGSEVSLPLTEWSARGVTRIDGSPLSSTAGKARLLLPAGYRGPAFLALDNFRAVLRYNNAVSYALAVNHLADRLRGAGPIQRAWPRDLRPLGRSQRIELQQRLTAQGYAIGQADGILGGRTQEAVRQLQQRLGLPEDGYATLDLLERLRGM